MDVIFDRLIGPFPFTGSYKAGGEITRRLRDCETCRSPGRDMHVSATTVAQVKRSLSTPNNP